MGIESRIGPQLRIKGIMVHEALGCLAEEDGSYSKARIAMLIVGIVFLGFFIWLIVLSVEINNKEHSEPKVVTEPTSPSGAPASTPTGQTSSSGAPASTQTGQTSPSGAPLSTPKISTEAPEKKPYCINIDTS